MNKQIEEMAKTLCGEKENDCRKCYSCGGICEFWMESSVLYNAGYRKLPENLGEFSDGYHTFDELYHHRAVLFSVICNMFPDKAWKSKLHDTGDMFDGMFIVGIETEQGQATYHYDIDPYWDMFKVKELEQAPKWDGHSPSVAIDRIGNLSTKGYRKQIEGEWKILKMGDGEKVRTCSACLISQTVNVYKGKVMFRYCPYCGAKMKGGETDA